MMRRKLYLGFGCLALLEFINLLVKHDAILFVCMVALLIPVVIYDLLQTKHAILRNFPLLGHIRYVIEFFRPEIQQYLIAGNDTERPFNRNIRSVVYQRSKNVRDTVPYGTDNNIREVGYTWVLHSMRPYHFDEVESRIVVGGSRCSQPYNASRLNISAMSFGALSANALMALNRGAQLGGFAHNTGEGGISPYHLQGGDIVFQIGTGYFGCRDAEGRFDAEEFVKEAMRPQVKMIEVKISQGAKPSHGGILPAAKVTPEIAKVRKVQLGMDVVSPPAHSAFSTPKELLLFLDKLRDLSGGKPVGFKLCVGKKSEFLSICKAMLETDLLPDFITVDGAEGGTGAAPFEFANKIGEPLEEALIFVHNALVGINVRDKIRVICSGKTTTGFDLVQRLAMGADICNSARAMMMSIGCLQSKQCDANTCPTGIATQDKWLQRGLVVDEKKYRVDNFHRNTVKSFLEIVGAMGLKNPSDLTPGHLVRRISIQQVKTFAEMYEYLSPGALLASSVPASFKADWAQAHAEKF